MPTLMTEAIARSLYARRQPQQQGEPPTPPITYGRAYFADSDQFIRRTEAILEAATSTNPDVLVVGSGFGYLIEALDEAGVSAWGIDPGPWYWRTDNHSEWPPGVKARTANDSVGSGSEADSLTAIGAPLTFDVVIVEDADPAHSDTELAAFHDAVENRLTGSDYGQIIHFVTPLRPEQGPGDSSQNWKTLTEWEATAPAHTWLKA